MRQVWGIYILRQLTSPALRLGALCVIAVALVSSVSIKNVLANAVATSGLSGLARFSLYAVLDTTVFVQILLFLALALALWFTVDAVRTAIFTRSMQTSA